MMKNMPLSFSAPLIVMMNLFQLARFKKMAAMVMVVLLSTFQMAHAGVDTGLAGDDYVAGPFPIGFTFKYYGQEFTQFFASTNGLLQFGGESSEYSNRCNSGSGIGIANTIFVFWDDLRTDVAGQPNGKIQYETIGQAPNRKLIVQWTNQYFYDSNLPMGTFQAVLFEGTNQIKLQYRYLNGTRGQGDSATIGLQGSTTGQVMQLGCNQANTVNAEQAISYTPDATGTQYTENRAETYDFLDISGLTPEAPISPRYTKIAPTWTWTKIPSLNQYQVEVQTDTGDVVATETLGDVASYTLATNFEAGKTYLAKVRGSVNSGGTWELWSGLSQPVTIDQTIPMAQITSAQQVSPNSVEWRYSGSDYLSGIDKIKLQLSTAEDFSTLLLEDIQNGANLSYTYTGAVPGQRIYGRVIATDRAGNESAASAPSSVLIVPPPEARFDANPLSGEVKLNVSFQNQTTGAATLYAWNFGNGQTSTAANPAVTYTQAGTYTVTLQATGDGGTTQATQTITVTPDVTRPLIGSFMSNNTAVNGLLTVAQTTPLTFNVTDGNGVQTVTAQFAGAPITVRSLAANSYQIDLNPLQYQNGDYQLEITSTDIAGNTSTYQQAIKIEVPPPAAPTISTASPARTNQTTLTITATSAQGAQAQVLVNDVAQGDWFTIASTTFTTNVTLTEGVNRVKIIVRNNRGTSAPSNELSITLDTTKPSAPTNLTVSSQAQGKVRLTWVASKDSNSVGQVVLRSSSSFEAASAAVRLNNNLIAGGVFEDIPPADGVYYYRVAAVNQLGTYSNLSNLAQAQADNTLPQAVSITYSSLGRVDSATGRYGQGRVNVVLTTSEALQTTPYLSIVPQGGTPITVELVRATDTRYEGNFLIDANTPSGMANAIFSARDLVGNRGTEILAGGTLNIDTSGPVLSGIVLNPASPIKNDTAQTIDVTWTFNKVPASAPVFKYALSGPLRSPVTLTGVTRINDLTYRGSFSLPADAGLGQPETLSFSHQSKDDLENLSSKVTAPNRFQVYQGNLPPLDSPYAFTAKAQPGGKAKLTWQAVADASSYQLYRQAPGQTALEPLTRTSGIEYIDQTPSDGRYSYAVAAVRQANGQESLSALSSVVEVLTSATAPGAPQSLTLTLTGQGIYAAWQPPLSSSVDFYNLYRATGSSVTSIEGLTPIKTKIKLPQTYDTNPSPTEGAYVVTAVDAAGNESAISNSAYLNASLLPVRNVRVDQIGNNVPVVSWTAPNSNVSGYLVYVGAASNQTQLTATPITATSFSDTGFTTGERRYTIASVDANGVEMPRSITLPNVTTQIIAGLPIKRGVMNKLQVQVTNTSSVSLEGVRVVVRLPIDKNATQFKDHPSATISLAPNQTQIVSVVVGGYTDLPSAPVATVSVDIAPNEGELIHIAREQTLTVTDSSLVVGMSTDEFTRGGTGKVKLTIENTSDVDVELLTATNGGANASSELRFKLLDGDNNVLATQAYQQVFGANVVTLVNGQTVARIPAGSRYVSETFNVNVPAGSPNTIRVRLEVDKLRYHSGQEDEVQIAGRGSEKTVSLIDTAYYGDVTNVTPTSSFGDQDIVITGRALDRANQAPLPNTRLKLVLNQQGFEREFNVLSDVSGNFTYTFKPTITDAGVYKVSAIHPDITDRPEQKAFVINRVTVGPTPYKLDVPKNYPFTIPFTAKAGAGTVATNLRLTLEAAAQPTGQLPAGVQVGLPTGVNLTERQTLNLPVTFTANNDAQPSGALIFNVLSDEHGNAPIGQVRVDYTLSEAKPYLVSTPSFVETGLAMGSSETESLTVKNNGLQDAINLRYTLTKSDGSAAPAWANISSAPNGTLAVGQSRAIDLTFSPPAGVAPAVYEFKLNVVGDNVPSQDLNVYVSLTQSGQGNVLFKASDIYTATVGKDGKLIPGLGGATVEVQNEDVPTITQELNTDVLGEALFQSLPTGRYKFKVKAPNHQELGGRLTVKPGITVNQPVFLNYNLITVEWSVREITIQDRYDITLNATFETDVPAAVVMIQPTSVNLPKMAPGDVFYGEFVLTNYGLIRAENVKQVLPRSDAYFRYEFLSELPTTLEAKQRVTIPYRIIALQSIEGAVSTGNESGGGCYSYSNSYGVTCDFKCANGNSSACGASGNWFSVSNSSCPGNGGLTGGGGWGGGWSGGGWGGYSGGSMPLKMKGKKCVFIPNGTTTQCN